MGVVSQKAKNCSTYLRLISLAVKAEVKFQFALIRDDKFLSTPENDRFRSAIFYQSKRSPDKKVKKKQKKLDS
jgi:hypothetical protein